MNTTRKLDSEVDGHDYWRERHRTLAGCHWSTGYWGSSASANAALYELRAAALARACKGRDLRGARVLDAGCGLGQFAEWYAKRGADVCGCDVSAEAVDHCRGTLPGAYECCALAEIPEAFPGRVFDYIHCFDVLYHVTDDTEWRETLQSFQRVSLPGTTWFVTEMVRPVATAPHVRVRGRQAYDVVLQSLGRRVVAEQRIHWLLNFSTPLHMRCPALASFAEPLCRVPFAARVSNNALWTIG